MLKVKQWQVHLKNTIILTLLSVHLLFKSRDLTLSPIPGLPDVHSNVTPFSVAFPAPLLHILQVAPIDVSSLISFTRLLGAMVLRGPPVVSRGWCPTEELKVFGVPAVLIEVSLEWPLGVFSGGHCEAFEARDLKEMKQKHGCIELHPPTGKGRGGGWRCWVTGEPEDRSL